MKILDFIWGCIMLVVTVVVGAVSVIGFLFVAGVILAIIVAVGVGFASLFT